MALTKIGTDGVKDDAITSGKIPANAVGSSELANNAVDTAAIADDAVTAAKIADNAVDTNAIANNAVTAGKLASGVQTTINNNADNRVITGSGTANTLEGESKFTFDGSLVTTEKRMVIGNGTDFQIPSRSHTSSYTPQFQVTGAWNDPTHGATIALNGRTDYPLLWLNSGASFQDNSGSGYIVYSIKDGAGNYCNTAAIRSRVDGTVGNNISPGALIFQTASAGTCQNSDRVTIDSSGDVKIHDGDLVIGTSGHGIDFSATSDTSGKTSELLDDYEEGTWIPTINSGFSATYTSNYGTYTKVGRLVYYNFYIQMSQVTGTSSDTNYGIIKGLPFTATFNNMLGYGASTIPWQYQLGQNIEHSYVDQNSTIIQLLLAPSGGDRTHSTASTLWNGGDTRIAGGGVYITG